MTRAWGPVRKIPKMWTALVVAGLVIGGLYLWGRATPVPDRVTTDQLGPDGGQQVSLYLDQARTSLDRPVGDPAAPRWALVSPEQGMTAAATWDLLQSVRISRVVLRVSFPRVAAPAVTVAVGQNKTSLDRAGAIAAHRVVQSPATPRAAAIARLSARKFAAGCACIIAVVVRADIPALRTIAARPGVRAVAALAPSATQFAVVPLLPQQRGVIAPEPDDGPVPGG